MSGPYDIKNKYLDGVLRLGAGYDTVTTDSEGNSVDRGNADLLWLGVVESGYALTGKDWSLGVNLTLIPTYGSSPSAKQRSSDIDPQGDNVSGNEVGRATLAYTLNATDGFGFQLEGGLLDTDLRNGGGLGPLFLNSMKYDTAMAKLGTLLGVSAEVTGEVGPFSGRFRGAYGNAMGLTFSDRSDGPSGVIDLFGRGDLKFGRFGLGLQGVFIRSNSENDYSGSISFNYNAREELYLKGKYGEGFSFEGQVRLGKLGDLNPSLALFGSASYFFDANHQIYVSYGFNNPIDNDAEAVSETSTGPMTESPANEATHVARAGYCYNNLWDESSNICFGVEAAVKPESGLNAVLFPVSLGFNVF